MIVTTGDLRGDYEILDAIFAMDSHAAGFFLGANPAQAFDGVKEKLRQAGREMRADAIICCQFEYRVAIADGLFGTK
jgi:hypothetical protein